MAPGFQIPKNGAAMIPPATETADGIAALERSIRRLQETSQRQPHGVFGHLTREEWDQLQFRHAAMHLSFILPG